MKLIILIILGTLLGCSSSEVSVHPYFNHVSRMMLQPDLFVGKKVTVYGLLSVSVSGDNLILLPDKSFEGLPIVYQNPYSIYVSPSIVRVNFEFNKVCLGKIVDIKGTIEKNNESYMIYPDIITQLKPININEKNCFINKKMFNK